MGPDYCKYRYSSIVEVFMIRIGDSAILKVSQITPQAKGVESRRYFDWETEWLQIADRCIKEKRFSVTTVSLNYFQKICSSLLKHSGATG